MGLRFSIPSNLFTALLNVQTDTKRFMFLVLSIKWRKVDDEEQAFIFQIIIWDFLLNESVHTHTHKSQV